MLKVKNLVKYYGDFKALKGISFELNKGEVLGILGPNGAGKTTLIKCILGFLYPSEGEISIFDFKPKDVNIKKIIGYLPENIHLPGYYKIKELLLTGCKLWDIENAKERIQFLINFFELEPFQDKETGRLSKGNLQKVAMAFSIIHYPEIIIWDEPTTGLDPFMRRKIVEFIKEEKRRGKSFLISSHVLSEVEKTVDRVLFIKDGKCIAQGELKEFMKDDRETLEDVFFRIMKK